MKLTLLTLALLSSQIMSCTKNLEGYYTSKDKKKFIEIYKDKDSDKLYFAELAEYPSKDGEYRGKGELEMAKQKDGKGYDLVIRGASVGVSLYPSDGGKIKMKSGKDDIYSPYKAKPEVKTLAEKARTYLKGEIDSDQPNSPNHNHMTGPNNKVVDSSGMGVAQKAFDKKLKDTPYTVKIGKPTKLNDYFLHTQVSVISTLTFKAHSVKSEAWNGCKDVSFEYVDKFKTCLKCPPDHSYSKKSDSEYRCQKSHFFMMGSVDKGKAEMQPPVQHTYEVSTDAAEILMTTSLYLNKETGAFDGRLADKTYTFNGENVTEEWGSDTLYRKMFNLKEVVVDGQAMSH